MVTDRLLITDRGIPTERYRILSDIVRTKIRQRNSIEFYLILSELRYTNHLSDIVRTEIHQRNSIEFYLILSELHLAM